MGNEPENCVIVSIFHPVCLGLCVQSSLGDVTVQTTKWDRFYFIMSPLCLFFFFPHISFLLFHRYKSSSSGCRPQARTEGAWRGHSSVAQPSCPESHNHSGHMDSKCSFSFCMENAETIFNFQEIHHFHLISSSLYTGGTYSR